VTAGQTVTPKNDLAEAVLNADDPAALMRYLSEQPTELAALLTSPDPRTFWRRLGQAEARLSVPNRPIPKTITDAPEPPPTVGTRVSALSDTEAAVKANDQRAYNAARDRERMARMRP
jgi:hypothetical protein